MMDWNPGSVAMLKHCNNGIIGPDEWRGPAESDLNLRIHTHRCRFCGMAMEPYKDYGNSLIWKCNNEFCINNPDCKLKADYNFTGVEFATSGNPDLTWSPWNLKNRI